MVQINMLPWRERVRDIKKKNFFVALAAVVAFAFFFIFIFHLYYGDLVRYQDRRNDFLQNEIAQKQAEINILRTEKEQQGLIEKKLVFLMKLREQSYQAIRILNEALRLVPDSITLTKLSREDHKVMLEGRAQTELAITGFLKALAELASFKQAILTNISSEQPNKESPERVFQIKVEKKEDLLKDSKPEQASVPSAGGVPANGP